MLFIIKYQQILQQNKNECHQMINIQNSNCSLKRPDYYTHSLWLSIKVPPYCRCSDNSNYHSLNDQTLNLRQIFQIVAVVNLVATQFIVYAKSFIQMAKNSLFIHILSKLASMKKKEDRTKKPVKSSTTLRMDTEAGLTQSAKSKKQKRSNQECRHQNKEKRQQPQRQITNHSNESQTTAYKKPRLNIQIKQILQTLWTLKDHLQNEYEQLLTNIKNVQIYQQSVKLLSTNYFRFRQTTIDAALNQYSNVLIALELLISKLSNNQKFTSGVFVKDEQNFVLFFKKFFSKPYTQMNLPSVRKVIKLLWDQFLFASLTPPAIINNLKLWIFGISAPLNPTMNKLHQVCTEKNEQISKLVNHRTNECIYIGVNESDALCLTPLMVATISKNIKGVEKLIKNGADPYRCPLVFNSKTVSESIQSSKFGNKTLLKKSIGLKERVQPDVIQILRSEKRIDEIAQIVCWQSFYDMKKLRNDTNLSDFLQTFPDCSFQLDWKEQRGMLSFKQLPQDIVSVYKRKHCLRIDFHLSDLGTAQKSKPNHYSLIFKAEPKKPNQLFFINHGERKIRDLIEDRDLQSVKEKYNTILKYGNIYNSTISEIKGIYFNDDKRLSITLETSYQNLTKFSMYSFNSLKGYFSSIVNTDLINYKQLQAHQLSGVLEQKIVKPEKVKAKTNESSCTLDIQWTTQSLNLTHLEFVLKLALLTSPSSLLLNKFTTILKALDDPVMKNYNFRKQLPVRCKLSGWDQINLQSQIKNIAYTELEQSIFKVQIKAKEMQYEQIEEPVDRSHLEDTVYMDEMYSINTSRFFGKSEMIIELEEHEANQQFEELLRLEGLWEDEEA